jgi:hypothetical protein
LEIITTLRNNIKKIATELSKLSKHTKIIIKWGMNIFLTLFALGTILIFYNRATLSFNSYLDLIATSIIKASFTILAETIIGGLFIDYAFNKT